ncbi:MAG: hypothetical protein IJ336_10320 [Lachnospiraceae bacterium]|nr:hypothetical protein [Lachnospiraceae bacterium]
MKRKNIKRECGLLVLILCIAGTLTGCGILEHFDISGNAEVVSEVISTEPESNTQEVSEEPSSQEESEDVSEEVSENSEVAEPDEAEPTEDESMEEPIVELGEIAEADLHALFEEYIRNDAAILLQHYEEAEYAYYDINGDGMDELVLREPENTIVIQYQNGVLVNLCENMYHATLLNDGRLMCYEVDGHYESYVFFEYDNGQYKPSLTM